VNSTRIRALLAEGEVEVAQRLLDRAYTVRGRVVEGDKRGRTIGFPTANLAPENEVLPACGVYAGRVQVLGTTEWHAAVVNVGRRPTFELGDTVLAEAHLLDFNEDLYGKRIDLAFTHRLRDERRFPDVDALREQIARDADEARARLGSTV
jgi:riboflavin kinase/FMN adenylyltransferase